MMFDSFEAYDVQETRRVSREEGRIEGERAGRIEGEQLYLIKQIIKRIIKNSKMVKKHHASFFPKHGVFHWYILIISI